MPWTTHPPSLDIVEAPGKPKVILHVVTANDMGVGGPIDEHGHATSVEHHVRMVFLEIAHDHTCQKTLTLDVRQFKGRASGLRYLFLVIGRMQAIRSECSGVGVAMPVGHGNGSFSCRADQRNTTLLGKRNGKIEVVSRRALDSGIRYRVGKDGVGRTVNGIRIQPMHHTKKRLQGHLNLGCRCPIHMDHQFCFLARQQPHMSDTTRAFQHSQIRLPSLRDALIAVAAMRCETGRQLNHGHGRILKERGCRICMET